jgi:hypothetical protein
MNRTTHRFPATMDSLAKSLSFVVVIIVLIPILTIVSVYSKHHDWRMLIAPVIVLLALGITALYRVKSYSLGADGLHINRPVGAVKYPLHQIRSIASVTSKDLGMGIRTFGSGGFLGYFGKFYYRNYGNMTLYVTDREKMLLITLDDDRKVIISPDDTAAFMAAFQELMKR